MHRRGQSDSSALGGWQLNDPGQAPDLLDDADLLDWIQERGDDPALASTLLRRRYERGWTRVEDAVRRVVTERAETLGARIGTTASTMLVPPLLVLALGGSALHALLLAFVLVACGSVMILARGADVIVRVLVLQAVGTIVAVTPQLGFFGALLFGAYVPTAVAAGAAVLGSRIGAWTVRDAHGRRHARPALPKAAPSSSGSRDAVAA